MPCLSEDDRKNILELARQAVDDAVCGQRRLVDIPQNGVFGERCGVFVTVRTEGRLRGCIGVIEAKEPLGESLARCAASAALEDPRFLPMKPEELAKMQLEVSLLSPLERIRPEKVEIGRHGLLVEQGHHRGLLLPQVATEHHLNHEQFLKETCHKAGLPGDAWRAPETQIYGFTCEIMVERR
jgi:AmmeMemoRadiSam system protein A